MSLYPPPTVIKAEVFSAMPTELRIKKRTQWADFNKAGQPVDCFLEGPSFDRAGNLIVTDIPHLHCSRAELDGLLMSLLQYGVHTFGANDGQWIEPGGRHWMALPGYDGELYE